MPGKLLWHRDKMKDTPTLSLELTKLPPILTGGLIEFGLCKHCTPDLRKFIKIHKAAALGKAQSSLVVYIPSKRIRKLGFSVK